MSRAVPPHLATRLVAATLFAFLVGAVVWFPAALAVQALPAPYVCAAPSGSLWRGGCEDLRVADASGGTLSWRLRTLPLLRGRFSADLSWARSGSFLDGRVDAGFASIEVHSLRGEADISTVRALPIWPPSLLRSWSPGDGRLRIDLARIELRDRRLTRIEGRVDVDRLVSLGRERWDLGDYRLDWREGPTPVGRLTDRGGPLALEATIAAAGMTGDADAPPGGAWSLEGLVQARDPDWRPRLMVFGPPDTVGRHALSVEWR